MSGDPRLLRAIGEALGRDEPYRERHGARDQAFSLSVGRLLPAASGRASNEVLGGRLEPGGGRVAWVEEIVEPHDPGGYVPVDILLRVAAGGELLLERPIESYNPYFGCRVGYVEWYGDEVVVIYREKHDTLVWVVPVDGGEARLVEVGDGPLLLDDVVYAAGETPGTIESFALPSLAGCVPLPMRGCPWLVELVEEEGEVAVYGEEEDAPRLHERLRPPAPEQRGFAELGVDAIAAALGHPSADAIDLEVLIFSVAQPFLCPPQTPRSGYAGGPPPGSGLDWLGVYWAEHRGAPFLELLERVALPDTEPERGWQSEWDMVDGLHHLAARHVRRRATSLLGAAREGRLPGGQYCFLWSQLDRLERARWRPAFTRAVEALAATSPVSLSRRND